MPDSSMRICFGILRGFLALIIQRLKNCVSSSQT